MSEITFREALIEYGATIPESAFVGYEPTVIDGPHYDLRVGYEKVFKYPDYEFMDFVIIPSSNSDSDANLIERANAAYLENNFGEHISTNRHGSVIVYLDEKMDSDAASNLISALAMLADNLVIDGSVYSELEENMIRSDYDNFERRQYNNQIARSRYLSEDYEYEDVIEMIEMKIGKDFLTDLRERFEIEFTLSFDETCFNFPNLTDEQISHYANLIAD